MIGITDLESINYSQLFLISKSKAPATVREYRPITLLNSSLKIVSKVLANRLSSLLTKLIGDYQSGFIKWRNILEGVAKAHEIIHQVSKAQKFGYLLKLDFEKVYDTIDWECLLEVLKHKGFGNRWIERIKHWLASVKCHILLNGVRSKEMICKRGLR